MHRAFSIPEIVFSICNTLAHGTADIDGDGPYTISDPATLAICARTCRAFHLPAVSALWQYDMLTMETVLLHCMPSDLWNLETGAEQYLSRRADRMTLQRPIRPDDLTRLAHYAPLINRIAVGSASHHLYIRANRRRLANPPFLSDDAHLALSLACPTPIFPNLRHLFWNDQSANILRITPYLSPSLVTLDIDLHDSNPTHSPIIQHLPLRCPDMSQFTISCLAEHELALRNIASMLSPAVCAWNLRKFGSPTADHATIRHLSQCPSLTTLSIYYLAPPLDQSDTAKLTHPGAFSFLRTMLIHRLAMDRCVELIQGCSFTNLEELTLKPLNPSTSSFSGLLRAIRDAHARPQLLHLLRVAENTVLTQVDPPPLRDADIEPLLTFPALSGLVLSCAGGFDLADSTILRMTEAWPSLERLKLSGLQRPTWDRRLSLRALVPLALNCPKLRTLALELDATRVAYDRNPPRPATPHCLRHISVLWSPIGSHRVVAGFLSVVFPGVRAVLVADDVDERAARRWDLVGLTTQLIAKLREHERMDRLGLSQPSVNSNVDDVDYISTPESEAEVND